MSMNTHTHIYVEVDDDDPYTHDFFLSTRNVDFIEAFYSTLDVSYKTLLAQRSYPRVCKIIMMM